MNNTLGDLNNYLFEALERITDDSLSPEELDRELDRCETMTKVVDNIIKNADLMFKAAKHADEWAKPVPPMLSAGTS